MIVVVNSVLVCRFKVDEVVTKKNQLQVGHSPGFYSNITY
jgi:hypothetical protein